MAVPAACEDDDLGVKTDSGGNTPNCAAAGAFCFVVLKSLVMIGRVTTVSTHIFQNP